MKRKLMALLVATTMVFSLMPAAAFADSPQEGEIPINETVYKIDSSGEDSEKPDKLDEGQIWVNKDVIDNAGGEFEITLYAWGAEYTDIDGNIQMPLDPGNTDITITDTIGEWFEYNKDAECNAGFSLCVK